MARQREASKELAAAGGDLPLGRRELRSEQMRQPGLLASEGDQCFGIRSSWTVSTTVSVTTAGQRLLERLGRDVEGSKQAIRDIVELAIEGSRGNTGAGRDPLRGRTEVAVFVEDIGGGGEQPRTLALGDSGGREPVAAPRQPPA
ncbi:MAG TPA: hypothetical protein VLL27_07620 [Solirubrobacterales bacterium]|nr:hypothetical protein [Solirubrobacterales bacterium]